MKAVCWKGIQNVQVEEVPDPEILNPNDAIIRVTSTAICGSDLHLYNGYIPAMLPGDILGHEFMGEVVQVGSGVKNLKPDDRVVVPFPIACGSCYFCQHEMWSLCDNSNPNAAQAEALYGFSPCRHLWLFASPGRLRRWAGRVCARAICRCRPAEGKRELDR
jgi:threonine dehydrogenase-like Zn-dependent dehydrogenase